MASSNLARWGGPVAVVGGVLVMWAFLLIPLFGSTGVLGSLYRLYVALSSLSWLLLVGGLVVLHARQANALCWLGAAGFAIAFVGGLAVAVRSFVCMRRARCPDLTPRAMDLAAGWRSWSGKRDCCSWALRPCPRGRYHCLKRPCRWQSFWSFPSPSY
jgi:hypothetical protein